MSLPGASLLLAAATMAAEGRPVEPTVETMVVSPAVQRRAEDFATAGRGTSADPWTGWEAALDGIPSSGMRVLFGRGHYRQRRPIAVPVELEGWLEILGDGATILLTRAAPRFLDVGRSADGQRLRKIRVGGIDIDAGRLGGRHHVIFGTYQDGSTLSGRCLDIEQIVVHDVRTRNVLTHPEPNVNHRLNFWLGSFDPGRDAEACPQGEATVRDVLVEDLDLEGGNMGVVIFGSGADPSRVRLDGIHVHRVRHDLGPPPRKGYYASNVHLGSRGHGGYAHVSGVTGRNSADVGIEVNGFVDALIENNTIENAFYAAFLLRNYSDAVDVARQRFVVRDNTVVYSSTAGGGRSKRGVSISESGRYPVGSVSLESYAYFANENEWTGKGSCLHVDLRNPADRRIEVDRFRCSLYALDDDGGLGLRPILVESRVPVAARLTDGVVDLRGRYRGRASGEVTGMWIEGPVETTIRDVECSFRVDVPAQTVQRCVVP